MVNQRQWQWLLLMGMLVLPTPLWAAQLRGQIHRIGFAGSTRDIALGGGQDLCRLGDWTPVRIELTNTDGDLFDGTIEVHQADRDGDIVVARRPVAVRGTSRYFLYIPSAQPFMSDVGSTFSVQVLDKDGRPAPLLDEQGHPIPSINPVRGVRVLPNEYCFILDISARPLTQLSRLLEEESVNRPFAICRASASELPDSVAGLDSVDMIVWDAADPSGMDAPQRDVLLEWTRRGGTLILGVSKNWELLARSRFAEILPAQLTGATSTQDIRELGMFLFNTSAETTAPLMTPLIIAPVYQKDLLPGARIIEPSGREPLGRSVEQTQLYVTSRACGQGQVILVSAEMADMFGQASQSSFYFLQRLIPIRQSPVQQTPNTNFGMGHRPADFFRYIEDAIAFRDISSSYFLVLLLFVGSYIAIATIGIWVWLCKRQMSRHSWTVFALVAALASGASILAVQGIRWFGSGVRELSVVRCQAGSTAAAATCYLGYKTSLHVVQDLCVPVETRRNQDSVELVASLRPLPASSDAMSENAYSASLHYTAVPELGELRSLPMRATLKQLEARWYGTLNGQVQASLSRERAGSNSLATQSWIQNDLPCDLQECVLLVASRDISPELPGGSVRNANNITLYNLPDLPRGTRLDWDTLTQSEKFKTGLSLSVEQENWLRAAGFDVQSYNEEPKLSTNSSARFCALRLLATFQELDRRSYQDYEFERSHGQQLDCMNRLDRDTAILLAFSTKPGPARLCVRKSGTDRSRNRILEPREALVMYQVAIPLQSPR